MLLRNARLDGQLVDLRVDNGLIAEIGPGLSAASGQARDLGGRHVVPGLWDEHVHMTQAALTQQRLDLSAATSAREAAGMVREALATAVPGHMLVGQGFRDALWPDLPTLDLLDVATGGHPVVLISADLHAVWLNSAALTLYGQSGHPTGVLREEPAFTVTRLVGEVPAAVLDEWVAEAGRRAAARGVVGIVDLEMDWNLATWQRRMETGFDSVRVEFGIYRQHLEQAIDLALRTGRHMTDLLTVGRFKVLTDGSLNTRTAYCAAPYPHHDGGHGQLEVPREELVGLLHRAVGAGIEPSVHAIGDAAVTIALDAFDQVGCGGRIEHAQLVAPSDLPRFAQLGVVASVQPEHAMDDRDVVERYWSDRAERAFAWRSLLEAGAELRFGSDAPVAPLDPWVTMAAAVGRDRDGREPWQPQERLTNAQALAASARSRVAVGQPADLVVTDVDPFTAESDALRTMPVVATILGGRFTHDRL